MNAYSAIVGRIAIALLFILYGGYKVLDFEHFWHQLEFDGFPALQFSGWPSVSVGSFGGIVQVIDYVNSKPGEFRMLVVPDTADVAWPRQIRNGSGTQSWVMLDNVPVWYEIWRQLNGFPPSLYEEPEDEYEKDKSAKNSEPSKK